MKPVPPVYTTVEKRAVALDANRHRKMARSSHAYVRGNTQKFYEWLNSERRMTLPTGPSVWICGDCHVGNLGPIADVEGKIVVQVRDLDQTVIGNPAHDLVRLGLSLASAARGSDLPGVTTARMIEQMVEGYEEAFADLRRGEDGKVARPEVVKIAMRDSLRRKWKHLAKERIKDGRARIPLGLRFWPLSDDERAEIGAFFKQEQARRLVTSLRGRDDDAEVEVLDAAYWMKGCSSLGRLRYAVLLSVGGAGGELCLMDIKEAAQAVAPRAPDSAMPADNAERVVMGACHLSPALGERMLAGRLQERSIFVRELLPQDIKFEIENLREGEAIKVAKFLATVVGRAHARQLDDGQRESWLNELTGNRSKTLDAPSWLWSSVVELLVNHEGAYLEHCRTHVPAP